MIAEGWLFKPASYRRGTLFFYDNTTVGQLVFESFKPLGCSFLSTSTSQILMWKLGKLPWVIFAHRRNSLTFKPCSKPSSTPKCVVFVVQTPLWSLLFHVICWMHTILCMYTIHVPKQRYPPSLFSSSIVSFVNDRSEKQHFWTVLSKSYLGYIPVVIRHSCRFHYFW